MTLEAGIVGRDETTLCAFYTAALGFVLVERHTFPVGTVCRLARGDARIKIFFPHDAVAPVAAAEPWYRPGGWRYAALAVARFDEVDGLADAAVAAGGRVVLAPSDHRDGARMAMITDPEGNAWELLAEARADEEGSP